LGAIAGCVENSPVLSFETRKFTVWADSLAGPALIAVAQATLCAGASSATVWFAPLVKLGATLIPVTVIVKVCGALVDAPPPLSCSETVTVATVPIPALAATA
jgi:hypothetical protein